MMQPECYTPNDKNINSNKLPNDIGDKNNSVERCRYFLDYLLIPIQLPIHFYPRLSILFSANPMIFICKVF